jgi:hypothetical protein
MAKLSFSQRLKTDVRFKEAVDDLVQRQILKLAGLDPEALVQRWEDGLPLEDETAPQRKAEQPSKAEEEVAEPPKAPARKRAAKKTAKKATPKTDE